MKKEHPRAFSKMAFGRLLRSYSFTRKEAYSLLEQVPTLRMRSINEIEETLTVLESLQFLDLKQCIMMYPYLLLIDAFALGEHIQKYLHQYYDMKLVREKILSYYQ